MKDQNTNKQVVLGLLIGMAIIFTMIPLFKLLSSSTPSDQTPTSTETQSTTDASNYYGDGLVILDDGFVTIKVTSVNKTDLYDDGVNVVFSVYNKSQQHLTVLMKDVYINGVKISEYAIGGNSGDIEPGKTGVLTFPFSYSKFYVNSYEDLETMQLCFNVMDSEVYEKQYTTSPITFDLVAGDKVLF